MPSITSNLTTFTNKVANNMTNTTNNTEWYWDNPNNGQTNDNNYTIFQWHGIIGPANPAPINGVGQSDILDCRQLVSTVPSGATINGIEVTVRAFNSLANSYDVDDNINLLKGGSIIVHPATKPTYLWSLTETIQTYGGPTDLWGTTWSDTDVNGAGFGVSLQVNISIAPLTDPNTTPSIATVDQVYVTIYYTGGTSSTNINPYGIRSTEFVNPLHRLVRNIKEYSVSTADRLGVTTLTKVAYPIRSYSVISAQNLGQAKLNTSVKPFSIRSNEVLGRNSLIQNIKSYSINTADKLSYNTLSAVSNIRPFGIVSPTSIGQARLNQNISSYSIKSNDVLGNQSLVQNIKPFPIRSLEIVGFGKIVSNINPYSIRSNENLGINSLLTTANIISYSISSNQVLGFATRLSSGAVINHYSIKTNDSLGRTTLSTSVQINPKSVVSTQTIGVQTLSTNYNIYPKSIVSLQSLGQYKFRNRFYDPLDDVNIFNYGDTGSFLWEQANSIYPGGKTLRRSTAFPNTTGVQTIALPMLYDRGPDFYWAGYVQILSGNGIAGMAFAVQSSNVNNGYYAVINAANTTANPSFSIRKIVGSTTTVLQSFNLAGLVSANNLYRIIVTWSDTGVITAKLYSQGGGTLAATITATDTTYTTGYIGITAFSDAAFDHLTNIEAQFADPVVGIQSGERLGYNSLILGATSIRAYSLYTGEKVTGLNKLNYNFNAKSIISLQSLGYDTLNKESLFINPYSIISLEKLAPFIYTVPIGSQIRPFRIYSLEKTGDQRLNTGSVTINPYGVNYLTAMGFNTSLAINIRPYPILSNQAVSYNNLKTSISIFAKSLIGLEKIGYLTLSKNQYNIYPYGSNAFSNLGYSSLTTRANINPYGQLSQDKLGITNLSTRTNIVPYSIKSVEFLGYQASLLSRTNILPYSILTNQKVSYNILSANKNIIPYSIISLDRIGYNTLSTTVNINPYGVRTLQVLGRTNLSLAAYNIIPYAINRQTDIGYNTLRTNANINPYAIISTARNGYNSLTTITRINPYSIYSLQNIGRTSLLAGSLNINPYAIQKQTEIGYVNLSANKNIIPYQIFTRENVSQLTNLLVGGVNIRPNSVFTAERLGRNTITGQSVYILPPSILSLQNLSYNTLNTFVSIYPYQIKSVELLGRQNLTRNIYHKSIFTTEKISYNSLVKEAYLLRPYQLFSSQNIGYDSLSTTKSIVPYAIYSLDKIGYNRLNSQTYILPYGISSREVLGSNVKFNFIIQPYSQNNSQSLGYNTLSSAFNIRPYSVNNFSNTGYHRLDSLASIRPYSLRSLEAIGLPKLNTFIKPYAIDNSQSLGQHALSSATSIVPYAIKTLESLGYHKFVRSIKPYSIYSVEALGYGLRFRNKFYDTLDYGNVFNFGNTDQFVWEQANSLFVGGYSLRRSTAPPNTTGTATIAYPLEYLSGADFYWAGWLQILSGNGIAGMAFGVQASDVRNGYFAVINAANTSVNPSFSIRKVVNGVTTTTLASYNLSGLITPNTWYRIAIYWTSAGVITAKLYAQGGGVLVQAGVLTVTDTTYTKGYMGITAFSDTAFDHLTNIEAQFVEPNFGVRTLERLGLPTLSVSGVIINLASRGIYSTQNVGYDTLSPNYNIYPKAIIKQERVGLVSFTLASNINPYGIQSKESASAGHLLISLGSEIRAYQLFSAQLFGSHRLSPGSVTINPYGVYTINKLGYNRISPNYNIIPYNIYSTEKISYNTLTSSANIRPYSIISQQVLGYHRLSLEAINIRPYSIFSMQKSGYHKLSAQYTINPYGIFSLQSNGYHSLNATTNINPFAIRSVEKIGYHTLNTSAFIYPYAMSSKQAAGYHTLNSIYNIRPYGINSREYLGLHTLSSTKNIYPYQIFSIERLGRQNLNSGAIVINPYAIFTRESIGYHTLRSAVNINPYGILTNAQLGYHRLTASTNILPYGMNTRDSLGYHRLSTANNIIPYSIYSIEKIGVHTLRTNANIYPYGIRTLEKVGYHTFGTVGVNIRPYQIISNERIGYHKLSASYSIYPFGINTSQTLGYHTLRSSNNIIPYALRTLEKLGVHILNAAKNIYPYGINTTERVGYHRLTSVTQIIPYSIFTNEKIGLHTLSNILAIYPFGIRSIEKLGYHTLRTATNIYPYAVNDIAKLGYHTLSFRSQILPYSIQSNSILGLHTLSSAKNIYPYSLGTNESLGYHLLAYAKTITPYSIISTEKLGYHRLTTSAYIYPYGYTGVDSITGGVMTLRYGQYIYLNNSWPNLPGYGPIKPSPTDLYPKAPTLLVGAVNIQPKPIVSVEKASYHRLSYEYLIKPYGIFTNESIGLHSLVIPPLIFRPYSIIGQQSNGLHILQNTYNLYPYGITGTEKTGYHRFDLFTAIRPYSIDSLQSIGQHKLDSTYNIYPKSIVDTSIIGLHSLEKASYRILPYSIISEEKLGLHALRTIAKILPYQINTNEITGWHKLTSIAYIYPYTQKSLEAISYNELRRRDNILHRSIASQQDVHNGNPDLSLFKLDGIGSSTEVFLTNDGTNIVYWDSTVLQFTEVIVNGNTLSSGYTLYSLAGKVVFDTALNPSDTVIVKVFKNSRKSLHRLFTEAFIRPWGIRSLARPGRHRLRLPQFPGFIHSWFERKQTIESEVTIVNLPIVGWIEKVHSIEVDIQILRNIDSTLEKVQTIEVDSNFRSTS